MSIRPSVDQKAGLQNRSDHRRSVFQQLFAQTHTEQNQHHAATTVAPDPECVPPNAHLVKSEERKSARGTTAVGLHHLISERDKKPKM
ncbi:hypothetical protein N0V86_005623 [Didymella sp. IMI 355093]|nr:hypothetical protein N0V86_005623 [Didymella sp. IMI 355093]